MRAPHGRHGIGSALSDGEGIAQKPANLWPGNRQSTDDLGDVVLGVEFMDAEHAALFAMYRALPAMASQSPKTCSTFANGFRELLAYARYHFAHEEEVMLRLAYPGYVDHRREHAMLLKDGDDFLSNIQTYYETYDCFSLMRYVRDWLRNHIRSRDSDLAAYVATAYADSIKPDMFIPRTATALASHRAAVRRR
jgi:hemerythrin